MKQITPQGVQFFKKLYLFLLPTYSHYYIIYSSAFHLVIYPPLQQGEKLKAQCVGFSAT